MTREQPSGAQPDAQRPDERREVRYAGRVQGVGFRYTTRGIAARLPVTGLVRNLSDGTVELVVEGSPQDLDRLLAAIAGELGRYIEHVDVISGRFVGQRQGRANFIAASRSRIQEVKDTRANPGRGTECGEVFSRTGAGPSA